MTYSDSIAEVIPGYAGGLTKGLTVTAVGSTPRLFSV
jgi:hypothetical protein